MCGHAPQHCVDECARLQFETRSRDAEDPECDPAGTVFGETLEGLTRIDQEALRFAGKSNLSAIRWLSAMGAGPKVQDKNGTTMLHAACRSGSCLIVQELVKNGLPLDATDSAGWTPLHIAAVMGRRDVTLLLLRVCANVAARNKNGLTPAALCSDPGTREVLDEFSIDSNMSQSHPKPHISDLLVTNMHGPHLDSDTATCEPFFVPRVPLFRDEVHHDKFIQLGIEMFARSAGQGLAFFVAAGVVHDHPTDLSAFLMKHQVCPVKLGDFLGEDFSLAQTLRLAFIHSVDLSGVGVVGALAKAFHHIRAPLDLEKIDRLTSAIAHLWWRTHDFNEWDEQHAEPQDEEGLDWTMFTEDFNGTAKEEVESEVMGMQLRQQLRSAEGLRRLMFSTVMLSWNLHPANRGVALPGSVSPRRLSFSGWLDMNVGIEVDGSNINVQVQKRVYNTIADGRSSELIPNTQDEPTPSLGSTALPGVQGWASVPRGGLERHEPIFYAATNGSGQRLAHCILSETSSGMPHQPYVPGGTPVGQTPSRHQPRDEGGEAVWLSLRFSALLFLSSGPNEVAPYAFIRMQDAVIRDVNHQNRHLILAGRPKSRSKAENSSGASKDTAGGSAVLSRLPFGDSARLPLPLCFLLADGRFQQFEALWLELQFNTDEELELWARELGDACNGKPSDTNKLLVDNVGSEGPSRAPRLTPAAPQGCQGDVHEHSSRSRSRSEASYFEPLQRETMSRSEASYFEPSLQRESSEQHAVNSPQQFGHEGASLHTAFMPEDPEGELGACKYSENGQGPRPAG